MNNNEKETIKKANARARLVIDILELLYGARLNRYEVIGALNSVIITYDSIAGSEQSEATAKAGGVEQNNGIA